MDQHGFVFRVIPCSSHAQTIGSSQYQVLGQFLLMWVLTPCMHVDFPLLSIDSVNSGDFAWLCCRLESRHWKKTFCFLLSKSEHSPPSVLRGKKVIFTGLAVKTDVQIICQMLYCTQFFFFNRYVFMSTFTIPIHSHVPMKATHLECYKFNEQTSEVKVSMQPSFHTKSHRSVEFGRWEEPLEII